MPPTEPLDANELQKRAQVLAERIDVLMSSPTARPTLVYFDFVGIAWPIRCLLHLAKVDYELVQISFPEWLVLAPEGDSLLKQRLRNFHVPLFVEGDLRLTQSNVIAQHLAERHDLLGDSPRERLAAQEVMAHAYDALFHWNGLFPVNATVGVPGDVAHDRLEAFLGNGTWGLSGNGYRRNLDAFDRYLEANPTQSGFMAGDRISVADLHAFNVLCHWYKAFDQKRFSEAYPRLDHYVERIATIPAISDYIRNVQEPTIWIPLEGFGVRLGRPEDACGLTSVHRVSPPRPASPPQHPSRDASALPRTSK